VIAVMRSPRRNAACRNDKVLVPMNGRATRGSSSFDQHQHFVVMEGCVCEGLQHHRAQ
jgi:hypothetical protein